jgi:uncharacterized RDD family membrane protein YckC
MALERLLKISILATYMQESYPQLSERVQSSFIDMLLVLILLFPISAVLDRFDPVPDWVRIAVFVALFLLYEPLCTCLGGTLGNYIKGLRVKRVGNTGKRINFLQAVVRYIIKVALGWVSFLTIHGTPKRRALHDLAVGSVMLKIK